jgi:hypothetical protein
MSESEISGTGAELTAGPTFRRVSLCEPTRKTTTFVEWLVAFDKYVTQKWGGANLPSKEPETWLYWFQNGLTPADAFLAEAAARAHADEREEIEKEAERRREEMEEARERVPAEIRRKAELETELDAIVDELSGNT